MAFNWFRSYTSEWELVPIDPGGWVEMEPLDMVRSFRFNANGDDDVPLLHSGSISIDTYEEDPPPGWYKIKGRLLSPSGDVVTYPMGVLVCESNDYTYDYGLNRLTMPGKSVLFPAKDKYMANGAFIPRGFSGAEWCAMMLQSCTPAPVRIVEDEDFIISRNYVFDNKTSVLKAVWNVLDGARWVMQIDGNGQITILPKPQYPVVRFEEEALSLFHPGLGRSTPISDVPNVYVCNYGNRHVRIVNDDPESIVSTVSRGYSKEVVDNDPMLINGEDVEHYAMRMLEEASTLVQTYSYRREVWEDTAPFDLAYYNIPGFVGEARVLTQGFDLESGGVQIDEIVGKEVKLWQMS